MSNLRRTYLHLGSNRGDTLANISTAVKKISELGELIGTSALYETEAWGETDQQNFLNQALELLTELKPQDLLAAVQAIETEMGRIRTKKWGPRLIDIDILLYDNFCIKEPNLVIPHPFLHERNFVLIPLAEIAGTFIHPVLNQPIQVLANLTKDKKAVVKRS